MGIFSSLVAEQEASKQLNPRDMTWTAEIISAQDNVTRSDLPY